MTNWKLIARYLTGQGTKQEEDRAKRWIDKVPGRQAFVDALADFFRNSRVDFSQFKDEDWKKLLTKADDQKAPVVASAARPSRMMWRVAASLLILITAGVFTYYFTGLGQQRETLYDLYEANAAPRHIVLTDGSNVFLNRHAVLKVSSAFGKQARRVTLEGEAFFEVTKDASCPFEVTAHDLSIRVLGTSFNVQNYFGNEAAVTVTVAEGKVGVSVIGDSVAAKHLTAGEAIAYTLKTGLGSIQPPDINYIAWKTGVVRFKETELGEVCEFLSRHYAIDVRLRAPHLAHRHITTELDNLSPQLALQVVALTLDLRVLREGNTFFLEQ